MYKNKIIKLSILFLIFTFVVSFGLFGCKKETTTKKEQFEVGFIIPGAYESFYFDTMADAVKAAVAKKENINVQVILGLDQQDIEVQIKIIEDLTQKNVDLLAVAVNDPNAVVSSLLKAQQKGIPVILLDTLKPPEGLDVLSLIGSDDETGGEMIAKYIVELLGGKGKIAVLEGIPGQYANEFRLKGFRSVIDSYPDIEIVASQPANWDRFQAMNVMKSILQSNPDIDLIWGVDDEMAIGAVKALEDAAATGKFYDVMVCGYNGDKEAIESLKKGKMKATILQQPAEIGRTVIKIADMIKKGRIDEVEKLIVIPIINVTSENVFDYIKIFSDIYS
ncbi:MAG: sugar ABC transporter substrate-binding protein [Actinobacteria bacterium]|nr:sugar ABC transporter substrate-binding protein [Actinomycetota bacterium]MCL6086960.1 sugar ABC transporter substrate-binding protein [Actinomycetota bacterium]